MSRWCQDKRYEEGKRDSERYEEGKRDSESFFRRFYVRVFIYEKTCNSRTRNIGLKVNYTKTTKVFLKHTIYNFIIWQFTF